MAIHTNSNISMHNDRLEIHRPIYRSVTVDFSNIVDLNARRFISHNHFRCEFCEEKHFITVWLQEFKSTQNRFSSHGYFLKYLVLRLTTIQYVLALFLRLVATFKMIINVVMAARHKMSTKITLLPALCRLKTSGQTLLNKGVMHMINTCKYFFSVYLFLGSKHKGSKSN